MSWDTVLNQAHVKDILRGILESGRIAHAYLFSGPSGAGMDAMALEFTKVLNCENSTTEACGNCPSCKLIERHQHPDIHLVFPLPVGKDEKSGDPPMSKLPEDEIAAVREQIELKWRNPYHRISLPRASMIKINSIREIRRKVSLMSSGKGKRVFVIIDAETMSADSSNALLKTLEEPPQGTILILTTSQPDQLLRTLSSRCQQIRFQSLTAEDIASGLMERENIPKGEAESVAKLARGSYSNALQILHSDYRKRQEDILNFLRLSVKKNESELIEYIDHLSADADRDDLTESLRFLQSWLRDAMVARYDESNSMTRPDETMRKFLDRYRSVDFQRAHEDLERAISLIGKNVYIPIILLTLAFSLEQSITGAPAEKFRRS